jgi:hypothetical protein
MYIGETAVYCYTLIRTQIVYSSGSAKCQTEAMLDFCLSSLASCYSQCPEPLELGSSALYVAKWSTTVAPNLATSTFFNNCISDDDTDNFTDGAVAIITLTNIYP